MFHAPTAEAKQQNGPIRSHSTPEPMRGLSPFVPANARPAWSRTGSRGVPPGANNGMRQPLALLHSTYGNQAVLRMMSHATPTIQAKLTVNQPGDPFEQEADRVADQVMRMTDAPSIQRKCSSCAEEEKVQRKCAECEEEEKKAGMQRKESSAGPQVAPPSVHHVVNSPGRPLDPFTRSFMEPRFGHDFSHVRVHTGPEAGESARAVNALAYTVGQHVVFGAGQYHPGSNTGQRLLAHELTHVIQQASPSSAQAAHPVQRSSIRTATAGHGLLQRQQPPPAQQSPQVTGGPDIGKILEALGGKRDAATIASMINACLQNVSPFPDGCSQDVINALQDLLKKSPPVTCPFDLVPGKGEFTGQCCNPSVKQSADTCCSMDGVDIMSQKCCKGGQIFDSKKRKCVPVCPVGWSPANDGTCCPGNQLTRMGECGPPCPPGSVPANDKTCCPKDKLTIMGTCSTAPPQPTTPPPSQPKPAPSQPAAPAPMVIKFNKDTPQTWFSGTSSFGASVTTDGQAVYNDLKTQMNTDLSLNVQLEGHASLEKPQTDTTYNDRLATRRVELIASKIQKDVTNGPARIQDTDASVPDCQHLKTGEWSCGDKGAQVENPEDRNVTARVFPAKSQTPQPQGGTPTP